MGKGPPAGNILRKQISLLPKYDLTITPVNENTVCIQLSLINHELLSENMDNLTTGSNHKSYLIVGDSENYVLQFISFRESDFISVYNGCIKFDVTRRHSNEHKVIAHCISSTLVGIDVKCEYSFLNINQVPEIDNNDIIPEPKCLEKRPYITHQKTITDAFKEKKRTILDTNNTSEKRKRKLSLVDRFTCRKENFEETTKQINEDFKKKADLSHNVLQNLTTPNLHLNKNSPTTSSLKHGIDDQFEDKFLENVFSENFEIDDLEIDEEKVENALNKMENDTKTMKLHSPVASETQYKKPEQFSYFQKKYPVKYKFQKHVETWNQTNIWNKQAPKHRKLNMKNNYAFLDKLDKKYVDDDINEKEAKSETTFSETVKSQIEKYLQRIKDITTIANPILEGTKASPNTIDKHVNSTDPTEFSIRESEPLQNFKYETDKDINNSLKSKVEYGNKLQVNEEINKFHESLEDYKEDKTLEYNKDETDNRGEILDFEDTYKDSPELSAQNDQLQESRERSLTLLVNKGINSSNLAKLIPRQYLEVMPYNEKANKITKPTELDKNNSKVIIPDQTDKVVLQKELNENKYLISTYVSEFNGSPFNELPVPHDNEIKKVAPANNGPCFVGREITEGNTNKIQDKNDSNKKSFNIPCTEKIIDKINAYSFGQVKTFSSYTKNSSEQPVQIISKVKVDIDITEIVYKKDISSPGSDEITNNTKHYVNPNKGFTEVPVCQIAYNESTTPQNLINKRLRINPCCYNKDFVEMTKCNTINKESYSKINTFKNSFALRDKNHNKDVIFSKNNKEINFNKNSLKEHVNINRQNNSIYEIQKFSRDRSSNQNSNILVAKICRNRKVMARDNIKPSHPSLTVENINVLSQKATAQCDHLRKNDTNLETQHISQNQNAILQSALSAMRKPIESPSNVNLLNSVNDNSVNEISDVILTPHQFCDDFINNSISSDDCNTKLITKECKLHTGNQMEDDIKPNLSPKEAKSITKMDNVKKIEPFNDFNERDLRKDKDITPIENESKNASVKDILQKYSKILKMQKQPTKNKFETNIYKNRVTRSKTDLLNTSKKYKIQDLDNIPLPQPLRTKLMCSDHFNKLSHEIALSKQHLTGNQIEAEVQPILFEEAKSIATMDNVKKFESTDECNESDHHCDNDTDILQEYSKILNMQKPITKNKFETSLYKNCVTSTKPDMAKSNRKYKIPTMDISVTQPLIKNITSQNLINQSENTIAQAANVKFSRIQQRRLEDNNTNPTGLTKTKDTIQIPLSQPHNENNSIAFKNFITRNDTNIEDTNFTKFSDSYKGRINEFHDSPLSPDCPTENDIDFEVLQSDSMLSPINSDDEPDLIQAILNPKAVLECMNNAQIDEIIKTPDVFRENNTSIYSPVYTKDKHITAEEISNKNCNDLHYALNDFESCEASDKFGNDSVVGLTPSNVVETWILSQEEDGKTGLCKPETSFCHFSKSCTSMPTNRFQNTQGSNKYSHPINSRQAKLSSFKFERKQFYIKKI